MVSYYDFYLVSKVYKVIPIKMHFNLYLSMIVFNNNLTHLLVPSVLITLLCNLIFSGSVIFAGLKATKKSQQI